MRLFRYKPDVNHYACIEMAGDFMSEVLPILDQFAEGTSLAGWWRPVEIVVDGSMGKLGDFPGLQASVPVFSRKAWETLRPLIGDDVEALPLTSSHGKFLAINILSIVNCLDHTHSVLTRYPDGRIQKVLSYAFRPNCLQGKHMMKLSEFKNLVSATSLIGLRLNPMVEVT